MRKWNHEELVVQALFFFFRRGFLDVTVLPTTE